MATTGSLLQWHLSKSMGLLLETVISGIAYVLSEKKVVSRHTMKALKACRGSRGTIIHNFNTRWM
jgi:hypothetical protein